MSSEKRGHVEVIKVVGNFLRTMSDLVRPVVNSYDVLLSIAESDPIMNGKARARLGKRAKEIEAEMKGFIDELKPARQLGTHIIPAIIAAAQDVKSKAALIESGCRTGNFQAIGWNSAFSMFANIAHSGEHMMNTIDNAFAQDVPSDLRREVVKALEDKYTKRWTRDAAKGLKKMEARAA